MDNFIVRTHAADLSIKIGAAQADYNEIAGSFAYGDDPESQKAEKSTVRKIQRQHREGDLWAWFDCRVEVEFFDRDMAIADLEPFTADEFLGCCNYRSLEDFTTPNDGYFADMLQTALTEIRERLAAEYPDSLENFDAQVQKYYTEIRGCDAPDLSPA